MQWFCVILILGAVGATSVYWWYGNIGGADLFAKADIHVRFGKPLGWSGENWLREDDEALMKRGGADLKARIESRLIKIGFVRHEPPDANSPAIFVGKYRGSPPIHVKLLDYVLVGEGGVHYEITAEYTCAFPESSSHRYQIRMSKLIKQFEIQLQTLMDDCRGELLAEFPEYQ